jgi:hypothetical protein
MREARRPGVVAQFCAFDVATPPWIAIYGVTHGPYGGQIGSGPERYLGSTTSGQHVFETFLGPVESFGGVVLYQREAARPVFLPNASLYASGQWSAWSPPDFVTDDPEIQNRLLTGARYETRAGGKIRALGRFRRATHVEYMQDGASRQKRTDLEPCPLPRTP